MVGAMEAALDKIMTRDTKGVEPNNSPLESVDSNSCFSKELRPSRSANDVQRSDSVPVEKDRGRMNLASLGLVNTSSRRGLFTDSDLFDDEEKFIEDEHADPEGYLDVKEPDGEINEVVPGDLGLAEDTSALTNDIERLAAQELVVVTFSQKAKLTNNLAELRILGKSKSSLKREIRRKKLQRQQYTVQESGNSLYGRAHVEITTVMVNKEDERAALALYVVEWQRKADKHLSAASWDISSTAQLETYPRKLLQLPAVCRSRDLRAFLSQQAIISSTDSGHDGERRDIVSRIYNSITNGMDEFLGNLPVLDKLSLAGLTLTSAATSQFNIMISNGGAETSQPAEEDNTTPPDLFKKSMLWMR